MNKKLKNYPKIPEKDNYFMDESKDQSVSDVSFKYPENKEQNSIKEDNKLEDINISYDDINNMIDEDINTHDNIDYEEESSYSNFSSFIDNFPPIDNEESIFQEEELNLKIKTKVINGIEIDFLN